MSAETWHQSVSAILAELWTYRAELASFFGGTVFGSLTGLLRDFLQDRMTRAEALREERRKHIGSLFQPLHQHMIALMTSDRISAEEAAMRHKSFLNFFHEVVERNTLIIPSRTLKRIAELTTLSAPHDIACLSAKVENEVREIGGM